MSNSVLDVINNRTSLRVYDNREISQEILDKILHAAMRAPTAGNQMLYSILVVRDEQTRNSSLKAVTIRHLLRLLR